MKKENNIPTIALQTIAIEIQAIEALKEAINSEFCATVEAIFQSKGRVIVSGIGKSALVAKKIVATFNSTGTPAIFMHASDAIHGDLGMIQKADIVLCLSKSGATTEIKVLVPLIKNLGNLLIGMTANEDSYLSKHADYHLHTPIVREADPNNLAPTASSTAQMVLGDALATALLALRGFSPNDFAQFHPGGALGKQLYLRVRDLYLQNERPEVNPSTSIQDTIIEMTSKRLGATAVIEEGQLVGIITDGDLRRMLEKKVAIDQLCAREVMNPQPKIIQKEDLAVKALEKMRAHSITQLIVMDQQQYLGFVHLHDLLKEGLI